MVPIKLQVMPDYSIKGQVGNATLTDAEISIDNHNHGYMIKAKLIGDIFPASDFNKKRVIFLLQIPEADGVAGDFHLKSNFIFDFSMRPGGFTLERVL